MNAVAVVAQSFSYFLQKQVSRDSSSPIVDSITVSEIVVTVVVMVSKRRATVVVAITANGTSWCGDHNLTRFGHYLGFVTLDWFP